MFINIVDEFTSEIINLNNIMNISKEDKPECMHEIIFHTIIDTEIRFSWRNQEDRDEVFNYILKGDING